MSTIDDRLERLEARVHHIENYLRGISTPESAPAQTATKPIPKGDEVLVHHTSGPTVIPRHQKDVKSSDSASLLATVAVICFVFAAAFIIKLAIDSDWLTPIRQIGLAAIFGVGLIVSGFRLLDSDKEYASYLPAAGVIVLYLAGFASHKYYQLVSYPMALGFTVVTSFICIWIYFQIRNEIYPIMAAIGAYATPVLMFYFNGEFTLYYYIVCSFAFSSISVWMNTRILSIVAAYAAVICTAIVGNGVGEPVLVSTLLFAHGLIFAFGAYLHTRQSGQTMTEEQGAALLPVLIVFYAAEYYFLGKTSSHIAPMISVMFAILLMGLHTMAKSQAKEPQLGSAIAVYGFASIVAFHSVYWVVLPREVKPWLLVLIIGALTIFPNRLGSKNEKAEFRMPLFVVGAILLIEFTRMVWGLMVDKDFDYVYVGLCTLAALWAMIILAKDKFPKETYQSILGGTHFLAILIFFRFVQSYGSLAVSALWLFYAAAVLGFAYQRKDSIMARSALLVLAMAAVKALLFDASSAPNVVRIVCLILTGAVLYGSGFLLRRIKTW